MKKIAIVGLGWLGMPLAQSLLEQGLRVVGSKTTLGGVDVVRMNGIECYLLMLTPDLICNMNDLQVLLQADVLIITLPVSNMVESSESYLHAVQLLVDTALANSVSRIIYTSSTSVYGVTEGLLREDSDLKPVTSAGSVLFKLEQWLNMLPNTSIDILRLAGLVGPGRHPGRFMAGKTGVKGGSQGVNLVHRDDVIAAIQLLLALPTGGHTYNLCAPVHPTKSEFYTTQAQALQLVYPEFVDDLIKEPQRLVDGSLICRELGFKYQYPDPANMPFIS